MKLILAVILPITVIVICEGRSQDLTFRKSVGRDDIGTREGKPATREDDTADNTGNNGCKCKDVEAANEDNCKYGYCYVTENSTCSDLDFSIRFPKNDTNEGEMVSYEACKGGCDGTEITGCNEDQACNERVTLGIMACGCKLKNANGLEEKCNGVEDCVDGSDEKKCDCGVNKKGEKLAQYKGDTYCDDLNNNEGCDWDGGDCCMEELKTEACEEEEACKCLKPDHPRFNGKREN